MNFVSVQIVIGEVRWERGKRVKLLSFYPNMLEIWFTCFISNKASVVFNCIIEFE